MIPTQHRLRWREPTALTGEQIDAIHAGLRHLAGNDYDYASEQNGVGFNRYDGAIGHSLAEAYTLSEKQAQLGLKLIRKYRRQLPSALLEMVGIA